nr:MAG TPA: DNA polymerase B Like Replicative Helicase [Caudoviricetes sp.]
MLNMFKLDILSTVIVLLYKERTLSDYTLDASYDSRELIKSILDEIKPKRKEILEGDAGDNIPNIITLVQTMVSDTEAYLDAATLLGELRIVFRNNETYYEAMKDQIEAKHDEAGKKRSITSLRNKVFRYYNELKAMKILNTTSFNINSGNIQSSVQEEIAKILPLLENLCKNSRIKGPEVMDKLVISKKEDVAAILKKIKSERSEGGLFKTGWIRMNKCLQGGYRKGEMAVIYALQHNYKSGMLQSLLMQFARYNKPSLKDPKKKPLIMYLSFEDEVPNILKFMYRYLYYNENKTLPEDTPDDITLKTDQEIQDYVMTRLGQNGFEIAIIRADPALWTYQDIFTTVTTYQAEGYEVQALLIDYLSKLPLTGCDTSGPMGTGIRDLFNRLRNFGTANGILILTPHQLSRDAKNLMRNGVPEESLVKELVGKGYSEGSSQIDQVVDLELYISKAKISEGGTKKWILTCQRGKHRGQAIIDESLQYFTLPFPRNAPILEDVNAGNITLDNIETPSIEDELFTES